MGIPVGKQYYYQLITGTKIATEIVTQSPYMDDSTKKAFIALIDSIESNSENKDEYWEILKDELSEWLANNQPQTFS